MKGWWRAKMERQSARDLTIIFGTYNGDQKHCPDFQSPEKWCISGGA
jgi:hypothetical protein